MTNPDVQPSQEGGPDPELARLLEAAREGDAPARDELFRQLRTYLLYIANDQMADLLQAKMGASDIVQQSMLRAAERFAEFRGNTGAEFKGWLRTILLNETRLVHREFRTEKRDIRREVSLPAAGVADPPATKFPPEPADPNLTPRAHALADEQAGVVRILIDQLPEDWRTIVHLRNWEGLSFQDIGNRMNMSTSGVAKIWYRALVEIQRLYQQYDEP